jgi:hypothetical protein
VTRVEARAVAKGGRRILTETIAEAGAEAGARAVVPTPGLNEDGIHPPI